MLTTGAQAGRLRPCLQRARHGARCAARGGAGAHGWRDAAARRLPGGAAPAGRCRGAGLRFLRLFRAQALRPDRHRRPVGPGELLDAMPPWQGGGAMIDRVTFESTTYAPAARSGSRLARRRSPRRSRSARRSIMSRHWARTRSTRMKPRWLAHARGAAAAERGHPVRAGG